MSKKESRSHIFTSCTLSFVDSFHAIGLFSGTSLPCKFSGIVNLSLELLLLGELLRLFVIFFCSSGSIFHLKFNGIGLLLKMLMNFVSRLLFIIQPKFSCITSKFRLGIYTSPRRKI